ncbi:MAG: hypothetical protein RPU14_07850 [Candidatus Sedimenticola sp. (ex Thyasira tokunagai)]
MPGTITEDDKYYAYQWIWKKVQESMRGAPTSIFDVGKAYEAYHALRFFWPEGGEGSAERLTVWANRYLDGFQWQQMWNFIFSQTEQELQLLQLQQQSQPASSSCPSLAQQQNSNDAGRSISQVLQDTSRLGGLPVLTSNDIDMELGPLGPIQTNQLIPPLPPAQQQNSNDAVRSYDQASQERSNFILEERRNLLLGEMFNISGAALKPQPLQSQPASSRLASPAQQQNYLAIQQPNILRPQTTSMLLSPQLDETQQQQLQPIKDSAVALNPQQPQATYRGRTEHDWGSITRHQWRTLTNRQIAQILGIDNPRTVSNYRLRNNLPRGPKDTKYNWGSITRHQWETLTNRQIARILGCNDPTIVCHHRLRHNLPRGPRG